MDKAKKVIALVSLCVVAIAGALLNSHDLPKYEHALAIIVTAFGALAHFLPSVGAQSAPSSDGSK